MLKKIFFFTIVFHTLFYSLLSSSNQSETNLIQGDFLKTNLYEPEAESIIMGETNDKSSTRQWFNWVTGYQGSGNIGSNIGKGICVGPDSRIFATGQVAANTPGSSNLPIIALNPDGSIDWSYEYHGGGFDMGYTIITDDEGNIYVAGESDDPSGGFRFIVISLDQEGEHRWTYTETTPNPSAVFDIIIAPDNNIYAAGLYDSGSPVQGNPGSAFIASLTTEGVHRWTHIFESPDDGIGVFLAIDSDNDSNIYAAGSADKDYLVYSINSEGEQRWYELYSGSATGIFRDNEATDIVVGSDGNIYVTGKFDEVAFSRVFMTMSFNPEGELLWQDMHAGSYNAGDIAWAITTGPDNSIYVAGKGVETGFMDVWVVLKYSLTGELLWTHFENPSPGINGLNSIVTDSQGNVYACGWTSGGTGGGGPRFGALGLTSEGSLLFTHIITPEGNNGTGDQVVIGNDDTAYMVGFSGASMTPGELQIASFRYEFEPPDFPPPHNLIAIEGDSIVYLNWDAPTRNDFNNNNEKFLNINSSTLKYNTRTLEGYNVYRDDILMNDALIDFTEYIDNDVINGTTYYYYVTAIYTEGESEPSNTVEATPEEEIIILIPPENLTANVYDNNKIQLSWEISEYGEDVYEFRYDDGEVDAQLGFQGDTNSVMGAAHRHNAEIHEITWITTAEGGPHNVVDVFLFGLDANGMPDRNDILYHAQNVPNTDNQWTIHELPEPVLAPNGFLVGLSYNGFLGLAVDDGIGAPWEFVPNTQFGIFDYTDTAYNWTDIDFWGFQVNYLLRTYGYDYGEINYATTNSVSNLPNKDQGVMTSFCNSSSSFNKAQPVINFSNIRSRNPLLTGFRIYRNNEILAETDAETMTYSDLDLPDGTYVYYVTALYDDLESDQSNSVEVTLVSTEDTVVDMYQTRLKSNYPNPFNPDTNIEFSLAETEYVTIEIYNILGQRISTLTSEEYSAGTHRVHWNGSDENGKEVVSGIYFYRMKTGRYTSTRKMILLK